jgi:hypothetical protein
MPAVVLVLAFVLGSMQIAAIRITLQDEAAVTARSLARGDNPPDHAGSSLTTHTRGDALCVRLDKHVELLRIPIVISASSCALSGGR